MNGEENENQQEYDEQNGEEYDGYNEDRDN